MIFLNTNEKKKKKKNKNINIKQKITNLKNEKVNEK
jgi:hypothetical protein